MGGTIDPAIMSVSKPGARHLPGSGTIGQPRGRAPGPFRHQGRGLKPDHLEAAVPDGTSLVVSTAINDAYANDRLASISHNGFSYTFAYDDLGNRTAVSVAGQDLVTYDYEPRTSRLNGFTYGNGQEISYEFDPLDRVSAVKFNDSVLCRYAYDASGNVGYHQDLVNDVSYRYIYDLAERLVRVTDTRDRVLAYDFDANNNVSLFTERIGGNEFANAFEFNRDNRPKEVNYSRGGTSTALNYLYDAIGRPVSTTLSTGQYQFTTAYDYIPGLNGSATTQIAGITNDSETISYTYDANWNIETITENGLEIRYYYDELNQLVREDNQVLNKTITYTYDGGGNILSRDEYAYTTGAPGTPTRTYSYLYDQEWKDKLVSFDGSTITYDEIGNPLSDGTYTYTWTQGRRLESISGDGLEISYKYNDSGIRTQKTVNEVTTDYHLVGGQVTFETDGTDEIYYTYDSLGDLVSFNLNGTEYFYIRNAQNDIIGIFDASGEKVVSYTYDSWGKLIDIDAEEGYESVGEKNPYRYRGYRYDIETGLYYLQSRYYNPELGRFLNADGLLGNSGDILTHNIFAYCGNNPVNYSDPSGAVFVFAAALYLVAQVIVVVVLATVVAIAAINLVANLANKISTQTTDKKTEPAINQTPTPGPNINPVPPSPTPKKNDPVHHIVAQGDHRADESRVILKSVFIHVDDPRNLVQLPQSYHAKLHTDAYHMYVYERLKPYKDDLAGVERTLLELRFEILFNCIYGVRWD